MQEEEWVEAQEEDEEDNFKGGIHLKIAISTDKGMVAEHFGRCPEFTIAEIENGKILKEETIPNPGHETGFLPKFFSEQGIECIIACGAGPRAINFFQEYGIKFIGAPAQDVKEILRKFADGSLEDKKGKCDPRSGVGYGIPKADGHGE